MLNRDRLDHLDSLFGASGYLACTVDMEGPLEKTVQRREVFCEHSLVYSWGITLKTFFIPFPLFRSLSPAELQAAICIHRDPAPTSEHGEGFLEAGPGLSLHIHRDVERR